MTNRLYAYLILALALLALAGCASPRGEAKKFVASVRADAVSISDAAFQLDTHVDEVGKPALKIIVAAADRQIKGCDSADRAIDSDTKLADKNQSTVDRLGGTIGVRLEKIFWFLLYSGIGVIAVGGVIWVVANVARLFVSPGSGLSGLLDFIHQPGAAIRGLRTLHPDPLNKRRGLVTK